MLLHRSSLATHSWICVARSQNKGTACSLLLLLKGMLNIYLPFLGLGDFFLKELKRHRITSTAASLCLLNHSRLLKSTMDMFLFQWCVRIMTAHIPDTHPCDGLSQGSVYQYFSTRLITDPWENIEKWVLIFPAKKDKRFLCYKNISRLLIPLSSIKKKKEKKRKEYNYVKKACSLK